jgi:hypothetical protein
MQNSIYSNFYFGIDGRSGRGRRWRDGRREGGGVDEVDGDEVDDGQEPTRRIILLLINLIVDRSNGDEPQHSSTTTTTTKCSTTISTSIPTISTRIGRRSRSGRDRWNERRFGKGTAAVIGGGSGPADAGGVARGEQRAPPHLRVWR